MVSVFVSLFTFVMAGNTKENSKPQKQHHFSIHFGISFTKGLSHTEVLNQLAKLIDKSSVQSIQLTERECIVTDCNPDAKHVLLTRGIELRNRYIKLVDVEKQVTNVTINDAPCELSDIAICGYISKFAEVVQDSLRRGTIKVTNIQTGTLYLQLTNCIPIIHNITKFVRFTIRIFADNNRTQCIYCSRTDHPSYRCDSKSQKSQNRDAVRSCYRCNSKEHTIKDCHHTDKVYFNCGHIQRECSTSDHEIFGDYVHEIREGRQAEMENPENKQEVSDINKNLNPVFEMKSSPSSSSQTVILGASNCTRIIIDDPNIHNLSVSGTTLDNVQSLLDKSDNEVEADFVKKVILSLGTNDISKHKNDVEQVNVNFTMCIEAAKQKYPFAKIGICNILPRRGKGIHLQL